MKFRGKRLLAVILSGVLYLIAMVLGIMFTQTGNQMKINAAAIGSAVLLVAWLVAGALAMRRSGKEHIDLKAHRKEILQKKSAIEIDPERVRRRVGRMALLVRAIHVLAILLVLAFAFLNAAQNVYPVFLSGMLSLLLLPELIGAYFHFRYTPETPCVDQKRFPQIVNVFEEAARLSGCRLPARLYVSGSGSIGAFRAEKANAYGIIADDMLVSMLTREELKNIFLHEFAHLTGHEEARQHRWNALAGRVSCMQDLMDEWRFFALGEIMLGAVYERFSMQLEEYSALISRRMEFEADRRAAETGDAQTFVDALAKTSIFGAYMREDTASPYRVFENETLPDDPDAIRAAEFDRLYAQRGAFWRKELETELPAQVDSHPTFRERREALGISEYVCDREEPNADYRHETLELRRWAGNELLRESGDYAKLRKRFYLDRKKNIERLDQPNLEMRAQIDGLFELIGLDDARAESLARKILENKPDNSRAALALAHCLAARRDDECIDWYYKAAESANTAPTAMEELGAYLLNRGYTDLIDDYRARSDSLVQGYVDFHEKMDRTNPKQLEDPQMDSELLKALVSEIVKGAESEIDQLYCCAKPLHGGKYAHIFFIDFAADVGAERREEIDKRAFYILDERPEDYALEDADDFDMYEIEKRAPHALVWQRTNSKGE